LKVEAKEEDKDDSDIDIKVEDLLQDLTIHDKEDAERKGSFDIKSSPHTGDETAEPNVDQNKKLLGKRDRKGDNI
jgi:hypothetical protein